jgi:hypothetical protein
MIQIIIVIIMISILLLLREYMTNLCFYDISDKKVVINEHKNRFILFKKNDSVSDMKILNILYQCDEVL